jgi:hypothetical protein
MDHFDEFGDGASSLTGSGGQFNVEQVVHLWVHCAKCLPQVQQWGIQDPYVVCTTIPSKCSTVRTKYDEDGGCNPVWGASEAILNPKETDEGVQLEVWNANTLFDDVIGTAMIPFSNIATTKRRICIQLSNGGVVECSFSLDRAVVQGDRKSKKVVVESSTSTQQLKASQQLLQEKPCSNRVLHIQIQSARHLRNPYMFTCTFCFFYVITSR